MIRTRYLVIPVALGLVTLLVQTAEAEVPSFDLIVKCKNGATNGVGFVVQDWTKPGPHLLLVTALHVILTRGAECSAKGSSNQIIVKGKECLIDETTGEIGSELGCLHRETLWTINNGSKVHVWPQYDLAAFPVREDVATRLKKAFKIRSAGWPWKVRFGAKLPRPTSGISIGMPFSIDEPGVGIVARNYKVRRLSRFVEQKTGRKRQQGSLSLDAQLMQYFTRTEPGSSGSPIESVEHGELLLGFHHAGNSSTNCGIALLFPAAPRLLGPQSTTRIGGSGWPSYRVPWLATGLPLPQSGPTVARWTKHWRLSVVMALEATVVDGGFSALQGLAIPMFSYDLIQWSKDTHHFSTGIYLGLGYRVGEFRLKFNSPDGSTLEEYTTISHGGLGEIGVTCRLFRTASIRPSVQLGIRLSRLGDADRSAGDGADLNDTWIWGAPVVRPQVSFSVFGYHSVTLGLGFALEQRASENLTYSGVGADHSTDGETWRPNFSIGVGYEY